MPLRNRVTPLGEIVAASGRGLVYGNRGCLHDAEGRIVRAAATTRWIACRLSYRGWYRAPAPAPGRYTALFFLDDATGLAAGHRPCALCRRADDDLVRERLGVSRAGELDAILDRERRAPRARAAASALPTGAFVLVGTSPHVVVDGALRAWSPDGYGRLRRPPDRPLVVVTPPSLARVLRDGWSPQVPFLHPSART